MTKKLPKICQLVVDELKGSPLSWIGYKGYPTYKPVIMCPKGSESVYGREFSESTLDALRRRGLVCYCALSDDQKNELKSRISSTQRRLTLITHGQILRESSGEKR